jgi:1-acyl-sn-glycerol-3-phosphate acyltransferase
MQSLFQIVRSIYIWFSIGFGTALMYFAALPVFLVTAPFDRRRRFGHWYAQMWGRGILKLNNRWSVEVRGQERIPKNRPLVVVANHQGMGDIMMAFCLNLHFKWISKRANFLVPFMGWFMFHAGYIPLVRGRKDSIEKCMAKARWWLDQGVSVLFFPEGTRSRDGNVKEFKRGAFKLALDAGCDILPVGIAGTIDALPKGTWKFSDEHSAMKLLVGDVISIKGYTDSKIDELILLTRDEVIALKDELDGRTYARPLRAAG